MEPVSAGAGIYLMGKAIIIGGVWLCGYICGRMDSRLAVQTAAGGVPGQTPITIQPDPAIKAKPVAEPEPIAEAEKRNVESEGDGRLAATINRWFGDEPLFERIRNSVVLATVVAKVTAVPRVHGIIQSLLHHKLAFLFASVPGFSFLGPSLVIALLIGGGYLLAATFLSGRLSFLGESRHVYEDVREFFRLVMEAVCAFFHPLRV